MKDQISGIIASLSIHGVILIGLVFITAYAGNTKEPVLVDFTLSYSLFGDGSGFGGNGGMGESSEGAGGGLKPAFDKDSGIAPGYVSAYTETSVDQTVLNTDSSNWQNPALKRDAIPSASEPKKQEEAVSPAAEEDVSEQSNKEAGTEKEKMGEEELTPEKSGDQSETGIIDETEKEPEMVESAKEHEDEPEIGVVKEEEPEPKVAEEKKKVEKPESEIVTKDVEKELIENEIVENQKTQIEFEKHPGENVNQNSRQQQIAGNNVAKNSSDNQAIKGYRGGYFGDSDTTMPGGGSGLGPGGGGSIDQYYLQQHFKYVSRRIRKSISYPDVAVRMGWSGKVHVSFLIGKNGDISDIKVVKSSGFPVLDKCATRTIRRIASFPKPPAAARVVLPINFKVDTKIVEAEI